MGVSKGAQPGLVFFYSSVSGACRRAEGFLAQVLQRRRNHETFRLYRVDQEERPVVEAIDLILAKAREHGVVPCIHNGRPEYARKMVEKGFRFVTVASDARLMAAGAQQVVARMREEPAQPLAGSTSY